MKPVLLAIFVISCSLGASVSSMSCPKSCKCFFDNGNLTAKCTSQKFLYKMDNHLANSFHALDLSNSSLSAINKRLGKLKNLKHLDLSNNDLQKIEFFPSLPKLETLLLANNKLEYIKFSILPKTIRDLNLSSNFIKDLPDDWMKLHNMTLHLQDNPIHCDESAIKKYMLLLELKVNITENVVCRSPKNLSGKTLQSLLVDNILYRMLGDQEDVPVITENDENTPSEEHFRDLDKNEFIAHSTEKSEVFDENWQNDLFDGSGEGSGSSENEELSACVIDCTTFKPLEVLNENDSSPILSFREQVGILLEDLLKKEQDEPLTTPSIADKNSITQQKVTTIEPKISKTTEKLVVGETQEKNLNNLERASLENSEDGYTYYLIAVVILLMVVVAIFIILKKRSFHGKMKRRRNSMVENGICEEMKPLGKYKEISNGTTNEKPKDEEIRPERIPLMNGQNGKSDLPSSVKDSLEELDITLRTPSDRNDSSPQPERVTITAGEIAPSVLKTPQLVHRQLNSEGEIVTKPLDDSY